MEQLSGIERLKGREVAYIPLVTLTPTALDIDHCDLTNSVGRGHVWSRQQGSYHSIGTEPPQIVQANMAPPVTTASEEHIKAVAYERRLNPSEVVEA